MKRITFSLDVQNTQTFLRVLATRWRRKPAGIDMERNYVTVTLCIRQITDLRLFICIFLYCFVCQYQSSDWL